MKKLIFLTCLIVILAMAGCQSGLLSTENELSSFIIPAADNPGLSSDATVTISGAQITVTLPTGTDVSALVARFVTSGISVVVAGISQVSGETANDFRTPVTYTITAEDGSTREYVVTVVFAV